MSCLSVSSYSRREQFGPLTFDFVDPEGNDVHVEFPYPKLLSLPEFPAWARDAFGVDAIEIVGFQFVGTDDPELDQFATAQGTAGIRLIDVVIDGGDLAEPDAGKRAADVEFVKRWIERFAAMGSRFVRVNPGSPFGRHHSDTPATRLTDTLGELGEFAKEHGTQLLVEDHGGRSSDPLWMKPLLDSVGRGICGLLLDLGNFGAVTGPVMPLLFGGENGQDPAEVGAELDRTSTYDAIEALAAYAELVSLKAHYVTDDGIAGPVDLVRAIGILADRRYTGPLSVEYEGTGGDPWANSARILDLVRAAPVSLAATE
ncbi:sugar phosphate isomerase/epimerase family protein [Sciscionella marina]|uniref:sugar phosphate isomerase/epimerase family protein n=1 Tax=Sciscionella marina TaxID=508770 RepID=UPI00037F948E|nr:sugar phosphate isomerase/epimerase family protein [Sciscionella marina]